jgi:hypothetical protein
MRRVAKKLGVGWLLETKISQNLVADDDKENRLQK